MIYPEDSVIQPLNNWVQNIFFSLDLMRDAKENREKSWRGDKREGTDGNETPNVRERFDSGVAHQQKLVVI